MSKTTANNTHRYEFFIHILAWSYVLISPFLIPHHGETMHWQRYVQFLIIPTMLCVTFYVNYFVLVPRYFMQHRYKTYYLANIVLIGICYLCIEGFMQWAIPYLNTLMNESGIPQHHPRPKHLHGSHPNPQMHLSMMARDIISLVFSAACAMALRLSIEWRHHELYSKETKLQHTDAALQNLKTQMSPHFLLNTLNNIYSLTVFDTEKAQHAILELSKMLRYQLYESDTEKVPLKKEADFLTNYIELMRLRLGEDVKVNFQSNIAPDESIVIAPHVLICLVENAFKHGISANEESFIDISLHADLQQIHFRCTNSNHPKSHTADKTPGGIGLQQVKQRLLLVYPDHHEWHYGPSADNKTYSSEIIIYNDAL